MELKFKYLLYFGAFTFVLVTVEGICNKDTIKYMLVKICGYGYNKRSNIDTFFQVMSREDVNKRFKEMVESNIIMLPDLTRHELGMDDDTEGKTFSPRVINPLKYNENTEDIQQEYETNGISRSRKLQKRNVLSSMLNKHGEKTGDTSKIKNYNGKIDDLVAGIVSKDDDTKGTNVHNGQSLIEKCCNALCSLADFTGYCS